jgi:hypothetical protein
MNQDEMMFEYLLQMGAMRPEEVEMMRKQKQIDALRGSSMETPQGQMIGKHYVPPSLTQYAAQLGQGYMAGKAQKGQDTAMRGMNERQRALLEEMRKRRMGGMTPGAYGMPDTGTGESSVY